jgi:peroxiredoxin
LLREGEVLVIHLINRGLVALCALPGPTPYSCAIPDGWSDVPDAPGCTGQSLALQKKEGELKERYGVRIVLLSLQSVEDQEKFRAERGLSLLMISDPLFRLYAHFGADCLPIFAHQGRLYYRRRTLILRDGDLLCSIEHPKPERAPDDISQTMTTMGLHTSPK